MDDLSPDEGEPSGIFAVEGDVRVNRGAGQRVPCSRCGAPCRVAVTRNEAARLLQHAEDANRGGWCQDCGATAFLQNTEPLATLLKERGPECLKAPHMREQFARMMAAGGADVRPAAINWDAVVANWRLPFPDHRTGNRMTTAPGRNRR
jgi:hypothetical protein